MFKLFDKIKFSFKRGDRTTTTTTTTTNINGDNNHLGDIIHPEIDLDAIFGAFVSGRMKNPDEDCAETLNKIIKDKKK